MPIIRRIPQEIIGKIAAGEVIERPVYAVKELIENSLDATADAISISLEEGGLKKITITDTGTGMRREDAELAFLPHTTSKLPDLNFSKIGTFGFRGEALSSIAAVSQMTIQTKHASEIAGTKIELSNGNPEKISAVGAPVGTTITVTNIFNNLPARKKFLSSALGEYRLILELLIQYALAYPQIKFKLVNNNKEIFDLPKQERLDRLPLALGEHVMPHVIPFQISDSYLQLEGFLAKPHLNAKTTQRQLFFLNGRKIIDKGISLAVKESYGNLLTTQSYPIFVLFLSLPPETIDINVHPRKELVRFINQQYVYDTIQKGVSETLSKNNLTFVNAAFLKSIGVEKISPRSANLQSFLSKDLKTESLPFSKRYLTELNPNESIGQLHQAYLVTSTHEGILLIDQHAAHERVLYEQLILRVHQTKKNYYQLPKPVTLPLSLIDAELVNQYQASLLTIGFIIQPKKNGGYQVIQIPLIFKDYDLTKLFQELLSDLESEKLIGMDTQTKKIASFIACRNAYKSGDYLTVAQRKTLLRELEELNNSYTCPHGRPTKIVISLDQLASAFKRR